MAAEEVMADVWRSEDMVDSKVSSSTPERCDGPSRNRQLGEAGFREISSWGGCCGARSSRHQKLLNSTKNPTPTSTKATAGSCSHRIPVRHKDEILRKLPARVPCLHDTSHSPPLGPEDWRDWE